MVLIVIPQMLVVVVESVSHCFQEGMVVSVLCWQGEAACRVGWRVRIKHRSSGPVAARSKRLLPLANQGGGAAAAAVLPRRLAV
ncbi:hypothetical protein [Ktedonobacter racemifer]|uniref:hypothetical protein n=1 Tax=Ktedonobacter racemifer TaxID=363277 RepID=UPI0012FBF1B5|nr:hypothetical protein [Ktedonobacter racemifer]